MNIQEPFLQAIKAVADALIEANEEIAYLKRQVTKLTVKTSHIVMGEDKTQRCSNCLALIHKPEIKEYPDGTLRKLVNPMKEPNDKEVEPRIVGACPQCGTKNVFIRDCCDTRTRYECRQCGCRFTEHFELRHVHTSAEKSGDMKWRYKEAGND